MDYELAKKLKDAGFPQEIRGGTVLGDWEMSIDEDGKSIPCNVCYVPTLEELVEACGINLTGIIQPQNYTNPDNLWYAGLIDASQEGYPSIDKDSPFGESSDLIEAVANLWLALNKKD